MHPTRPNDQIFQADLAFTPPLQDIQQCLLKAKEDVKLGEGQRLQLWGGL